MSHKIEEGIQQTDSGKYRGYYNGKFGPTVSTLTEARKWRDATTKGTTKRKGATSAELKERMPAIRIGKSIAAYLDECRQIRIAGKRRVGVALGALAGFPQFTTDADVVESAAVVFDSKAETAPGALKELHWRQRARDLRREADQLRARSNGGGDKARAAFVKHGKVWAETNGIEYATFRDMGVPAAVLAEAGITRAAK
jgi:hypothetical protein